MTNRLSNSLLIRKKVCEILQSSFTSAPCRISMLMTLVFPAWAAIMSGVETNFRSA